MGKNDFTCYEIHRPNIPDNGCTKQCDECKAKQEKQVHLNHCYMGDYEDTCKYGDDNCPAKPKEVEGNMISDWLRENGNPEIAKQVELEADIYHAASQYVDGGKLIPRTIKGSDRCKVVDLIFDAYVQGANNQSELLYTEEEVKKLLIDCKDRFGGSELEDYTPDGNVVKWFEQVKKK
jgi:hypothetical protein